MIGCTAILAIGIPLVTACLLTILQISVYSGAALKLRSIARQVGVHATNYNDPTTIKSESKKMAKALVKSYGMNCRVTDVEISTAKKDDEESIVSRITIVVPLLGIYPVETIWTKVEEEATVPIPSNKICACVVIVPDAGSKSAANNPDSAIYLPVIRPRRDLPVWSQPFDSTINSLRQTEGSPASIPQICEFNRLHSSRKSLY